MPFAIWQCDKLLADLTSRYYSMSSLIDRVSVLGSSVFWVRCISQIWLNDYSNTMLSMNAAQPAMPVEKGTWMTPQWV